MKRSTNDVATTDWIISSAKKMISILHGEPT